MPDQPKILDYEAALERVDNDAELYAELVRTLMEEYDEEIVKLTNSIDRGEASRVEQISHSLKSAFGNVGAMAAYAVVRDLEFAGKHNTMDRARELLLLLGNEVIKFTAEFERVSHGKADSN